jgi:hypothetical protein
MLPGHRGHFVPAAEMPALEQAVYEGYLAGLRAGGWDDDPRLVRLGMWSSAVKYDWLSAFTLAQVFQDRQYRYGAAARSTPRSSSGSAAGPCYSTRAGPARHSTCPTSWAARGQPEAVSR